MDVGAIRKFLKAMGCHKISVGSKWVRSTCPMDHRHSGGKDGQPSFAISIDPGDESNCRCLACGIYGPLVPLVWRLEADRRGSRPDLLAFLSRHNQLAYEKIDDTPRPIPLAKGATRCRVKYVPNPHRVSTFVHPDDEPQAEVPESVLAKMVADMPVHVLRYLTRPDDPIHGTPGRGLTKQAVVTWELGWHQRDQRVCIPIRDEDGKLVAISGRVFDDSVCAYCRVSLPQNGKDCLECGKRQPPKYLHSRFKRDRVLYGEHLRDTHNRTGYLFEGFFQAIYSWQCGYANTLARMGTHLSNHQAKKLVQWFDHLVIVPDGDKAGRDAAERDRRTLQDLSFDDGQGKVRRIERINVVDMPNKRDADTLTPADLRKRLGPLNTA